MGITQYILENAQRTPSKPAIVLGDKVISYKECIEQISRLSNGLKAIGVSKGDHVGVMLNNSVEFILVFLASADLGLAVVPLNNTTSFKDLVTAIDTSNIKYLFLLSLSSIKFKPKVGGISLKYF